jgi:hypothetical protein
MTTPRAPRSLPRLTGADGSACCSPIKSAPSAYADLLKETSSL